MPLAQPFPKVTPADVERIVRRDFHADEFSQVMTILSAYGTEKWHRERSRVQLAALKVANADIEKLQACIDAAKRDYRDALAAAEYPAYSKVALGRTIASEEHDRIIESDWRQYEGWLNRPA